MVLFGLNLLWKSGEIKGVYNVMRMKLACFILRQFIAAKQLSIAVVDGTHLKAWRNKPRVAIRITHRDVLWHLV